MKTLRIKDGNAEVMLDYVKDTKDYLEKGMLKILEDEYIGKDKAMQIYKSLKGNYGIATAMYRGLQQMARTNGYELRFFSCDLNYNDLHYTITPETVLRRMTCGCYIAPLKGATADKDTMLNKVREAIQDLNIA